MTRAQRCALIALFVVLLGACSGGGGGPAPAPPAPVVSLQASPASITLGGASTLAWTTSGATACSASGGWGGGQPLQGSAATGALAATASYTLTCSGTGGSTSATATVTVTPGTPWGHGDIGTPGVAGSFASAGGTITVAGSGADIWGTADAFQFVLQPLSGDGSITARVASQGNTDPWAKAGVMIRESLAPGARDVGAYLTPGNGGVLQARTVADGSSVSTQGPAVAAPYWVRLARNGNTFSAWLAPDGATWSLLGRYSVGMGSASYVGLAVTSHLDGTLSTATFDHVAISTVRLAPASASLATGATQQFTATAADGSAVAVTWQADGGGSISATGLYTAPSSLPASPATATITATSTQDPAATATATVTLSDPLSVTVSPRSAALTAGQGQAFAAAIPGGGGASWSVDGVAGGSSTVGTIDAAGHYVAPANAGLHTVTATSVADPTHVANATVAVTDLGGIYTYHADVARTGQNLHEYALTPASVASTAFGRRWTCAVDGDVYAQPLYVAHVAIAGGVHNVLVVATQHDTVYAFDADSPACATFWTVSFLGSGVTAVPVADTACDDILGEYGVTGTPVIDPDTSTLYLVAKTREGSSYVQRLHALDVATGSERAGSPVAISASVAQNGGGSVTFSPLWQNQRAGLALSGGGVYIAWAAHCDRNAYWGWVMRYDAASLAQTAVFNVAPNGTMGGIWMAGGAPAIDSGGSLYVATGNGTFDDTSSIVPPLAPGNDFGQTFLRLHPTSLAVQDFYTPSQEAAWSNLDLDIASSGVTVLPDGVGPSAHPNLLLGGDKQGHLWLLDRNQMQRFSATSDNVVQTVHVPGAATCSPYCLMSTPAYWNGTVYVAPTQGHVLALPLTAGLLPASFSVAAPASQSPNAFLYPGPVPFVSASPAGNAIVWALDNNANGTGNGSTAAGPAVLYAYDASDLGVLLYASVARPGDAAGIAVKFMQPVVANGHVYVAGSRQISVYGLAP